MEGLETNPNKYASVSDLLLASFRSKQRDIPFSAIRQLSSEWSRRLYKVCRTDSITIQLGINNASRLFWYARY
jgi:hypothetical protein